MPKPTAKSRLPFVIPPAEDKTLAAKLVTAGELLIHHTMRLLPTTWISNGVGGVFERLLLRTQPEVMAAAAANLRRIEPGWSEQRIAETARQHCASLARQFAEYAAVTRLWREGRVDFADISRLRALLADGPLIVIGLHTGNWEVMCGMGAIGIKTASFVAPRSKRSEELVCRRVRQELGHTMLRPGPGSIRAALGILRDGNPVTMYCDEVHQGRVMAPLFDRSPHVNGNLAIAVRIARLSGARLVTMHVRRLPGVRFEISLGSPITLEPETVPGERLLDDVAMLNGVIEPIIRANLDQWYFLDNALE
jgi:KDO2-lipid IV(A) lauroyltransferase